MGRLECLKVVLFTGSSVQAAIEAKLCFLGMPQPQSSLWGSAYFLPTCQAGLGSIPAQCKLAGRVGKRCAGSSAHGTAQQNIGIHLGCCSSLR